jgi:hypothetical protein
MELPKGFSRKLLQSKFIAASLKLDLAIGNDLFRPIPSQGVSWDSFLK